jgi:hypothetical protein
MSRRDSGGSVSSQKKESAEMKEIFIDDGHLDRLIDYRKELKRDIEKLEDKRASNFA